MTKKNSSARITAFFIKRASAGLTQKQAASFLEVKPSLLKKWESGAEVAPDEAIIALSGLIKPKTHPAGKFRFIDLFAGIGGLRRAFEAAGGECVFTSEWDKPALETYLANYGATHPVIGDITSFAPGDVPDHDVLVGGFPCQPFSLAGVSKKNSLGRPHGFADETQGTLFFHIAKILEKKRPRAFLLENVKNLLSHDKGKTFETIQRILSDDLGYRVSYKVIEATPWVPQRRPRIVIVGFLDGQEFDFDKVRVDVGETTLRDILHREGEDGSEHCPYAPNGVPLAKYTLTDGLWAYLQRHAAKHAQNGNGFGFGLVGPDDIARTLSARYYKDGSEILIKQEGMNPRRLTPRECARLMGFDRNRSQRTLIPVSDTQAYKQFGNSVVPPMFEAVAKAMKPMIVEGEPTNFLAPDEACLPSSAHFGNSDNRRPAVYFSPR